MKLIFLDIDGVLNCEEYAVNYEYARDIYGQLFYPKSQSLLNELIEQFDAKIVISSSWRHSGLSVMQEMWEHRNMSGEIIGITPSFASINNYQIPRGCEIEYFLNVNLNFEHINWDNKYQQQFMKNSNIENYIIIDADMLLHQRNNFIHVLPSPENKSGFNETYYNQAVNILSKTIIELNYD